MIMMMVMAIMMMPITSWELMAGAPGAKGIRNKTTYLPTGGNNTNRVSSIFRPRKNIATCMMTTKTIIC